MFHAIHVHAVHSDSYCQIACDMNQSQTLFLDTILCCCHMFWPPFSHAKLCVLHVEIDFHVDLSRVKECVCNVSFPINCLTLPAAFNVIRFTLLGEGNGENEDVINLLSAFFFYLAMKGLIYVDIIANSINYLKNLRNTKSCMGP